MPDTLLRSDAGIDPIALSVIWNGFISIAEEMGTTLRQTAYSDAVREGDDFSTGLFDRRGRMLSQGNFTPGHLGSMPFVVRSCMEYYPAARMQPGDSIAVNDSFLGSGHYPDIFIVTPVWVAGKIIGYAANIAHHADVGGAVPGSQAVVGVTEAFQEGLRILPVKLVRAGEFDPDLLRLVLGNVRLPERVKGDLRAQLNATFVGARRLERMYRDYGAPTMEGAIDAILDRSEARIRAQIAKIPDGVYRYDDHMDDYGPGTEPVLVNVDVIVAGSDITVDFSRSSDQVAAGMNCYINFTRAYVYFSVKVFADALLPQNDGVIRPIHVVGREGSFFNAAYPAASGGRAAVQIRIFEAINGALAAVLPERAMGAFSHWANVQMGGIDDATGEGFILYDVVFAGYGGHATKDGTEAMSPILNCPNIPVEVHEAHNPVLIRRQELIPDSAGPGRYRGGCGMRKDIELCTDSAVLNLLGDRHRFAPYGIFGGQPGTRAETILNPDGEATALSSKERRVIRRGDVVSLRLAGAGGYGDVGERTQAAVLEDVAEGYVTPAGARRDYGAALNPTASRRD
ncbi:MAG: hydantoinase B/oxoprolinase family protein [Alphaproteobacteria bacterium]|nr:hydantoinase B/oxoprolinase family protein [Alphaproteobacteria bacterium]